MRYIPNEEDFLRHRAFVITALAKELETDVTMDDSGCRISKVNICISISSAEDILAKPRLMRELREHIEKCEG